MSLLIAIVILLSILWGEVHTSSESSNTLATAFMTALLTGVAPGFAAIQMCIGRSRHRNERSSDWFPRFRTMVVAHSIVWTVASISIAVWIQWLDVVHATAWSETIPLADELLLIAPALIGLIGSWAIFIFAAPDGTLKKSKTRTSIFRLWLRMQVVMVTAPILFAFLVTDCFALVVRSELSPTGQTLLWGVAGIIITASTLFYPQLMLLVWSTKRMEDPELKSRMDNLFLRSGLRPRKVHIWQTNDSIVNAAAVGIVPGTEVVLVSDLLLKKFSPQEVDAIVLHEIGHIRHRHCIRRIAMVLIPLFLLAIDHASGIGLHAGIASSDLLARSVGALTPFLPAVGFMVYSLVISRTIFRSMEFEADQFAIESLHKIKKHSSSEQYVTAADAVLTALEKMAVIYPRLVDRRSGLHPSIRQRLAFAIEAQSRFAEQIQSDNSRPVPPPKSISLDPITAK
ncbi:M48 family metalloprotease [Mariniblastus fucicola]|uniref:Heat shock protein HtpX n=1 Tax=Mariniblastus fucicola TaxID=980251 RepID=A0A5B9PPL3_9BACT|nr:M48 family metalloprotease [Mariniblastus fucicola]QEG24213.1 heat shock protein HtpX [Mariniblastus fucicola]